VRRCFGKKYSNHGKREAQPHHCDVATKTPLVEKEMFKKKSTGGDKKKRGCRGKTGRKDDQRRVTQNSMTAGEKKWNPGRGF